MALFDDNDEQRTETESSGWGVEESSDSNLGVNHGTSEDSLADLNTATIADDDPNGTLKRAIDRDAGVVIYAYKNGNAGGLSAVPVSETDLDAEK